MVFEFKPTVNWSSIVDYKILKFTSRTCVLFSFDYVAYMTAYIGYV